MQLDRFAFDQDWLERLNTETVQRRGAVQKNRMLFGNFLEGVPNFRTLLLDKLLGGLDRRNDPVLLKLVVEEGLEQLDRHLLRQTALVQAQVRADDNHRTPRVVDALAEQVL